MVSGYVCGINTTQIIHSDNNLCTMKILQSERCDILFCQSTDLSLRSVFTSTYLQTVARLMVLLSIKSYYCSPPPFNLNSGIASTRKKRWLPLDNNYSSDEEIELFPPQICAFHDGHIFWLPWPEEAKLNTRLWQKIKRGRTQCHHSSACPEFVLHQRARPTGLWTHPFIIHAPVALIKDIAFLLMQLPDFQVVSTHDLNRAGAGGLYYNRKPTE